MKLSFIIASLLACVACSGSKVNDTAVCTQELGPNWWAPYASGGVQATSNIDPYRCAPVANVFCCITHD